MIAKFSLKESKNGPTFDITVTPRASRAGIDAQQEALKVKVTALPVDGAANEACIKLLAKELGLKKSQITILAGHKSRRKTVLVQGITAAELARKIKEILDR